MTSAKNTDKLLSHTQAWCAACRAKVPARLVERAGKVYLQKSCPEHGVSEALASGDSAWYLASRSYIKPGQEPLGHKTAYKGCPDSCGFCPEHQQHTCLPVIEILDRCDMDCPVCLKSFKRSFEFSEKDFGRALGGVLKTEKSTAVINLSGGGGAHHAPSAQPVRNIRTVIANSPRSFPFRRRVFLKFSRESRRFCL